MPPIVKLVAARMAEAGIATVATVIAANIVKMATEAMNKPKA